LLYQQLIQQLLVPFSDAHDKPIHNLGPVKNHICELFSFFAQHHNYRSRYFIIGFNIVGKLEKDMLYSREKYMVLACVRFFRAIIGMKDEFYNRYLIKNHLFDGIMEAFQSNGATYNLLNSAIIELFDFIRQENIKTLIKYVVDRFDSVFKSIDYVSTFRMLHLKYEQNLELEQTNGVLSRSNSVTALTTSGSHSDMDEDDESYFNESDDDDNNTNTTTIPVPTTQITVLTQAEIQILDDEKNNQITNNQHTNAPNIATNGNLNHKKTKRTKNATSRL